MRDPYSFRPLFDTQRTQSPDSAPQEIDLDAVWRCLEMVHGGPEGLARHFEEQRRKHTIGPAAYEKAKAAAAQHARADAVLANVGAHTPFISALTVALYADDFNHASRALVSLVQLVQIVRSGSAGEGSSEWGSSGVERTIRDYLASLSKGGVHRRKIPFCFANPQPLTGLQLRLIQHSRNGGKLGDFCAAEGFQAPFGTRQRVWAIYSAVAHDVPLPPTLIDFRRGVWAGPTEITEDDAATVAAVLKRATARLLPLIVDARERIEPQRVAEVAQVVHAAKVRAGKAAAAAKAARRAAKKPPLSKEEREARAEVALARVMERANTARERRRRKGETNEATPQN